MSLYGDAIRALRQVILLDERVRNSVVDLARISQEITDLRDRVSRLEGMMFPGKGDPESGSSIVTGVRRPSNCEKSPVRSAGVGTFAVREVCPGTRSAFQRP